MENNTLFQEIYEESFPSVSPKLRSKFESFLSSSRLDYKWLFSSNLDNGITQGDIVGVWPAYFLDEGSVKSSRKPVPAIMLQHTCDMSVDNGKTRNQNYSFAPLFPVSQLERYIKDVNAIKKNKITNKIYVGRISKLDDEYFADLDMIGNVKAAWFHQSINRGEIKKYCSLSNQGYFFLLAKLTVHFLRADTSMFTPSSQAVNTSL